MKVVLQRVNRASVTSDGQVTGEIGPGLLIFLGVSDADTEKAAESLAHKICRLRIFPDESGKTNLSLADIDGEVLVVSQFTLYADCRKGNRPSFTGAGAPELAKHLYDYFSACCGKYVDHVARGDFGAHMKVELENDGPFTIVLEDGPFNK